MLLDPHGWAGKQHLRLLYIKLGAIHQWPSRAIAALQVSLLIGIAILWRKLIIFSDAYPWALAPAFDDRCTASERETTLETFFKANWCCLDVGAQPSIA